MPAFQFDQLKTFEENCQAFISELESRDADLAAILRENWDQLLTVVQNGESSSQNRSAFNATISAALDKLTEEANQEEVD